MPVYARVNSQRKECERVRCTDSFHDDCCLWTRCRHPAWTSVASHKSEFQLHVLLSLALLTAALAFFVVSLPLLSLAVGCKPSVIMVFAFWLPSQC